MSFRIRTVVPAVMAGLVSVAAVVAPAQAQEAQSSGEVRRVNPAEGKITIKHGAIPELQLPAMSLVYRAESTLLQGIQPGDKITFSAKREGDHYVVTKISK
ncbi:MAG TPA: copper-binding protein [Pusillimonas sp.]|uniref:copper-binding protein n=1 Tax=Pusillimonas sp. TaxID=3040095 RepID=UPI002D036052|nr:copper-binding protein [Pusillimonas sp.]HUH86998.1 copper-binding protein [Pusillimonas sp.]